MTANRWLMLAKRKDGEMNTTPTSIDAARTVAREKYAWPGSYALFLVTEDGGILCADCVRSEYRLIYDAYMRRDSTGGWLPAGLTSIAEMDFDENALCDHCYRALDSI